MKYYLFCLPLLLTSCVSSDLLNTRGGRAPAEVTANTTQDQSGISTFKEKTIYLYPTLEIPAGSFFKRKDIETKDKCEVHFKKGDPKFNNGFNVEADLGFYSGIDKTHMGVGISSNDIPISVGCPEGVCEFESEYLSAPYNMIQVTKMWMDPYFKNVTRIETEFRRGPKGMKVEDMALQLKHTCTPEFLGM